VEPDPVSLRAGLRRIRGRVTLEYPVGYIGSLECVGKTEGREAGAYYEDRWNGGAERKRSEGAILGRGFGEGDEVMSR
jgi:hypothetical protein